jgi:hypothetical protein
MHKAFCGEEEELITELGEQDIALGLSWIQEEIF